MLFNLFMYILDYFSQEETENIQKFVNVSIIHFRATEYMLFYPVIYCRFKDPTYTEGFTTETLEFLVLTYFRFIFLNTYLSDFKKESIYSYINKIISIAYIYSYGTKIISFGYIFIWCYLIIKTIITLFI